MRRTFLFWLAIAFAIWSVSVDFPIPGSPVRRVNDACKNPPPIVRSSSSIPVFILRFSLFSNVAIDDVLVGADLRPVVLFA